MASIRKRQWKNKDGSVTVAWAVDFLDSSGERQREQFKSRGEANAFRVEIESQLRAGTFRPEAAKVTVKELGDQFLKHCEARMKRRERMTQRNYKTYVGHVRNYICPDAERHARGRRPKRLRRFEKGITAIRLSQLTPRVVADLGDRLREAGVSVPTTRKILGTLKVMLQYAIRRDLIAVNVAKNVTIIGRRDEGSKKVEPPSKEALKRLLEIADADFRVKMLVACATGVRAGELHALSTTVVEALSAWRLRTSHKKQNDLVFPNRNGGYVGHDNMVKRKFYPLFEKLAKLHADDPKNHPKPPARFNWHALRHFAVSCWIERGLSPKTVQTFAGHSSLQVTMDRYGHLFKSENHRQAMDAIAAEVFK